LGVQIIRTPGLHLSLYKKDVWLPLTIDSFLRQTFRQVRPEIVHIQDPSPLGQAVIHEAQRQAIPVIITHHPGSEIAAPYLHDVNPYLKRLTEKAVWKYFIAHLNQADQVAVPSRYSAGLVKDHGVQVPVQTIHCGVQLEVFRPRKDHDCSVRQRYGLDPEKTLFLYVGRVDVEKNLEVMLHAMAKVQRTDVQFAIAGRGFREAALRKLAVELKLGRRVRFLGAVEHAALPNLLNCADVFVMSGSAESFSIATLEAMACGKPILAARGGALPELVSHGWNGCLFHPTSPEDAAHWIEAMAEAPERLVEMGKNSLHKAQNYSINHVLQNYEDAYLRCIAKREAAALRVSPLVEPVVMPVTSRRLK
jgi:glycosyltransferase involved in cell wall biosynthesis